MLLCTFARSSKRQKVWVPAADIELRLASEPWTCLEQSRTTMLTCLHTLCSGNDYHSSRHSDGCYTVLLPLEGHKEVLSLCVMGDVHLA